MRIVVYNIHKCIGGLDRRYNPHRIRDTIAHHAPDVVLLQEVADGSSWSDRHKQADLLAVLLGFRHWAFFPNVRMRGGGAYGNAILSRYPITETRNIDLTIPLTKRRSALHARIRFRPSGHRHSRTVHFFNLHLGLAQLLRKRQLVRFLTCDPLARLHHRTPIIVAGDFNDVWGTLGPRFLVPAGFHGPAEPSRTFPAWAPLRALDSIYVRGDIVLVHVQPSRFTLAQRASDHLPLVAELALR